MVYDCTMTGVSWIEHGSQGPGGIWVSDDMCALDKAMPLKRPRWYMASRWQVCAGQSNAAQRAPVVYGCMMTGVCWTKQCRSEGPGGIWLHDGMRAWDRAPRLGPGGI